MVEAYLTEDSRSERKVAIDALPAMSIKDEIWRGRLIGEAQEDAQLSNGVAALITGETAPVK